MKEHFTEGKEILLLDTWYSTSHPAMFRISRPFSTSPKYYGKPASPLATTERFPTRRSDTKFNSLGIRRLLGYTFETFVVCTLYGQRAKGETVTIFSIKYFSWDGEEYILFNLQCQTNCPHVLCKEFLGH